MLPELDGERFLPFELLCRRREEWRRAGLRVVLTNGCFDLLHPGHIFLLQQAVALGDRLVVALNSDGSVRALKGKQRPILCETLRAYSLLALRSVSAVFLFDGTRVTDEIRALSPDAYVRAADRTIQDLDSKELRALRSVGARIHFVDFLPGFSTTATIARLRGLP
jgi:D-beta-D-heptose 7-phosphate kinase/D-beta-D-heptose 1-phosphate adenosyltransferase